MSSSDATLGVHFDRTSSLQAPSGWRCENCCYKGGLGAISVLCDEFRLVPGKPFGLAG